MNTVLFLACLGGGPRLHIAYYASTFGLGITLASFLLSLHRRSFAWLPLCSLLLLLHPAWMMSTGRGVGGFSRQFFSLAVSVIFVGILTCQVFWPQLSRRRFLIRLCAIFWVTYFADGFVDRLTSYLGLQNPEGGLISETLFSFIVAGKDLGLVTLGLTAVCLIQWLFTQPWRTLRSRQTGSATNRAKPPLLRRVYGLLTVLLLTFILLIAATDPVFEITALIWGIILVIVTWHGKLPRWRLDQS